MNDLGEAYGEVAYDAHTMALGRPCEPWAELSLEQKVAWMEAGTAVIRRHLTHERDVLHECEDGEFWEGAD